MFLLCLLLPYAAVVAACAFVFMRRALMSVRDVCGASPVRPFTVVVCTSDADVHTCARNIGVIASSLGSSGSLIVVADHVSTSGLALLRHTAEAGRCAVRVVENAQRRGKKFAQREGVLAARTESVVCMDADCVVGDGFAVAVGAAIDGFGGKPFMLLLPVEMRGDGSFLGRLVEMEFGCLQVVTAGSALLGRPSMANGAGMAFCRGMFLAHDPRSRYASGDDMFLLAHAIHSGASVRYLLDGRAAVSTVAPAGVEAYLRQRTRWLAKAGGYRDWGVILLALVVFAAVVAWPLALALACAGFVSWAGFAAVFLAKLAIDALACAAWVVFRLGWRGLLRLWVAVPLEALYPAMVAVVSFRALLADRSRW